MVSVERVDEYCHIEQEVSIYRMLYDMYCPLFTLNERVLLLDQGVSIYTILYVMYCPLFTLNEHVLL